MATSISISALLVWAPTRAFQRRHKQLDRLSRCSATPLLRNDASLFSSGEKEFAVERALGVGSRRVSGYVQGRRGMLVKAQENDEGGLQVDGNKPFYTTLEFWIQVAVVILTFGFVDAGYSGDWSRIGALSPETEAQLRTAAFVVVPVSAAVVWFVGKRKGTP